jgi:hypothetical protein
VVVRGKLLDCAVPLTVIGGCKERMWAFVKYALKISSPSKP